MTEPTIALYRSRVAEARVGRLATVTTEGHPHLVPCCFVLSGETIYSAVDHKPKSTRRLRRLENLRSNPNATLLVDHYADDWSNLWWVRADGTGRIIDDGPDLADAVALLVAKYSQYRDHPPAGPVIAIDITTWRGWP
jgi:PPOX class probable F420-dependent enzyme